MYLLDGLKSRDKEVAVELSKFLLRQLHGGGNSDDYKRNWESRIVSSYVYGYYLGFCVETSYFLIDSTNKKYRQKFIQYIFDQIKGNCGTIISNYIKATIRVNCGGGVPDNLHINLRKGFEKYLPGVALFCEGWNAGKIDSLAYSNRTNCELQLQGYMRTGGYKKHLDPVLFFSIDFSLQHFH